MTARVLDGKVIAARVLEQVARDAAEFTAASGIVPALHVVLVGDNAASASYVSSKRKKSHELGWSGSEVHQLAGDASQDAVSDLLRRLNDDRGVHGILLQLPLPPQCNEQALLEIIDPDKDVDGFHPTNVGRLSTGLPGPVPCTPAGIQRMLIEESIPTAGKHAVVVGRSNIVGKPVAALLLRKGPGGDATVTVAHSRTQDLPGVCRSADILIAAIGSAKFVKGDWVKPGATVIDVGINRVADASHPKGSRLVGDVDYEAAAQVASAITPVPGGVGPMTIAMLMANTLECARLQSR